MANQVSEIRRLGIDPTQNVWDFSIYGDPSQSPGFVAGVGSRAVQFDSAPVVGAIWVKTGPNATDWVQSAFSLTNPIAAANLPDLSAPIVTAELQLLTDPLTAPAPPLALGTIDDVRFAVAAGVR
jgi:hypothetical protein